MEASSPVLSADELRALPGIVRGLRTAAGELILWHSDGAISFASRGPDGQLWVDQRGTDGKVSRAGPLALAFTFAVLMYSLKGGGISGDHHRGSAAESTWGV